MHHPVLELNTWRQAPKPNILTTRPYAFILEERRKAIINDKQVKSANRQEWVSNHHSNEYMFFFIQLSSR